MTDSDSRWKQRFQNFEKAINHLRMAIEIDNPDIIQRAGLIQFFEMSFELGWNTLKDYLESIGFIDINSPRASIKKAFEINLIDNGHSWLQALEDRNLTSHAYDEEAIKQIVELIRKDYYPLLTALESTMKTKV